MTYVTESMKITLEIKITEKKKYSQDMFGLLFRWFYCFIDLNSLILFYGMPKFLLI